MTEYAIVATLIMLCSVTTLLTAGSSAVRELAEAHRLCVIQGENCSNDLHEDGDAGHEHAEDGDGDDGTPPEDPPFWRSWVDDPYLASFLGIFSWI